MVDNKTYPFIEKSNITTTKTIMSFGKEEIGYYNCSAIAFFSQQDEQLYDNVIDTLSNRILITTGKHCCA